MSIKQSSLLLHIMSLKIRVLLDKDLTFSSANFRVQVATAAAEYDIAVYYEQDSPSEQPDG